MVKLCAIVTAILGGLLFVCFVNEVSSKRVVEDFNPSDCIDQLERSFVEFKIPDGVRAMIDEIKRKIPGRPMLKIDAMELLRGDFGGAPEECSSYPEQVARVASSVACYKPDDEDPNMKDKEIALDEMAATKPILDDAIGAAGICGLLGDLSIDYESDEDD